MSLRSWVESLREMSLEENQQLLKTYQSKLKRTEEVLIGRPLSPSRQRMKAHCERVISDLQDEIERKNNGS